MTDRKILVPNIGMARSKRVRVDMEAAKQLALQCSHFLQDEFRGYAFGCDPADGTVIKIKILNLPSSHGEVVHVKNLLRPKQRAKVLRQVGGDLLERNNLPRVRTDTIDNTVLARDRRGSVVPEGSDDAYPRVTH